MTTTLAGWLASIYGQKAISKIFKNLNYLFLYIFMISLQPKGVKDNRDADWEGREYF